MVTNCMEREKYFYDWSEVQALVPDYLGERIKLGESPLAALFQQVL